jgi:predicted flap endonuclease-1-like 5' DNA nuclease
MLFSYILLHVSTFMQDLPVGLALCIVPFILGWLIAFGYYKVSDLRAQIASLTASNGTLTAENTDLKVKLTQADSEIHSLNEQIRKLKNDLIICQGDLHVAQANASGKGGASAPAAKPAAAATVMFAGTKFKQDDLKIVEGIGPKIAELLNAGGITTWNGLSETPVDRLKEILDAAGPNFRIHDPGTWPEQARLADTGSWDALKKLQDELTGGKA